MADLVEVLRSIDSAEAKIKVSILKGLGIRAVAISADLAAGVEAGRVAVPARVMVPDEQEAQAREVLAALENPPDDASGPEICPSCGEKWEPGFSVCWQCQHELPD